MDCSMLSLQLSDMGLRPPDSFTKTGNIYMRFSSTSFPLRLVVTVT